MIKVWTDWVCRGCRKGLRDFKRVLTFRYFSYYSLVPNKRGVQIVGGGKFSENLINGGPNKWGRIKLGNPYLKIRYKIMVHLLGILRKFNVPFS